MAKDEKGMTDSELHRKLLALWKRGQSDLCEVRGSSIHGSGVYAARDIAADELIIEYVGEFIDKEQSSKRSRNAEQQSRATKQQTRILT